MTFPFFEIVARRQTFRLNLRRRRVSWSLISLLITAFVSSNGFATPEELYTQHCASCHTGEGKGTGPAISSLRQMDRRRLYFALTEGKMREQGKALSRNELRSLVTYLGGPRERPEYKPSVAALCKDRAIDLTPVVAGWGIASDNSRLQRHTTIDRSNVGTLRLAWAFGIPNTGELRSQPVVTADTIFISSLAGDLFALGRDTGCIKWHRSLGAGVRTPLSLGNVDGAPALFMADYAEKLRAVNPLTGEDVWVSDASISDETMLTGGIVQHGDRLYVPISALGVALAQNPEYECCKGHGAVSAFEAKTGKVLWTTHMTEEAKPTYKSSVGTQLWGPSGVAVWATPTLDPKRNRLYIGTAENTSTPATALSDAVIALDMDDGHILWSYQGTSGDAYNMACWRGPSCPKEQGPDFDFGAPPVLVQLDSGREILVAGQKSGVVHALNPDNGQLLWQRELSQGTALGGVHWSISVVDNRIIVPINDPPIRRDFTPNPGIYALKPENGEVLWEHRPERDCTSDWRTGRPTRENSWPGCFYAYGFSSAITTTTELVFGARLDGHVTVLDIRNGNVVWQYDTVQPYETVNGVQAHGGSIDNPGVLVADDLMLIQSGYSQHGQMPGNALLVFRLADAED